MIKINLEATNVKAALEEITEWEEKHSNFLRDLEHHVNWEITIKPKPVLIGRTRIDTEINLLNNP